MLRFIVRALLAFAAAHMLCAAPSEWTDADGQHFKGEPIDVFGSLALFRTSDELVRRVPLRALSPEDCQRFYRAVSAKPARAARWSEAKGKATSELPGAVIKLDPQYRRTVPADLSTVPEPQLLFLLSGSHSDAASWDMLSNFIPTHIRIQRVYPGVVGTVFFGRAHEPAEHSRMMTEAWSPWLATVYEKQFQMSVLNRRAPREHAAMQVLTRDGDVLLSDRPAGVVSYRRFVDEFTSLLWCANPANARAWTDVVHYGKAVRPLQFADSATGPQLVGNPLKADGLRQRGIGRVAARLEIDAEGKVTSATLQPGSQVPESLTTQLTDAIVRSAVFLAAIDHGKPVAGGFDYVMEVPPADPTLSADAAWLDGTVTGEVPLLEWLVLKPIPVNQRDFDDVAGVDASGKLIMQAVEVSKAKVSRASQMTAFNSDWFAEAGAASVEPKPGEKLTIDGTTVTWRALRTDSGYVDMQTGERLAKEYCVGYAWTEIEVTAATNAWLAIGSDDGLKIWHNGTLVHDRWVRRQSHIDDDIVPLKLKAGKNRLLIKIQNATGEWSFVTRLRFKAK